MSDEDVWTDGAGGSGKRKRWSGPSLDEVRPKLWNSAVDPGRYGGGEQKYRAVIREQCKLYVEMTDRVSSRRD